MKDNDLDALLAEAKEANHWQNLVMIKVLVQKLASALRETAEQAEAWQRGLDTAAEVNRNLSAELAAARRLLNDQTDMCHDLSVKLEEAQRRYSESREATD